jgi:hypothetical protein
MDGCLLYTACFGSDWILPAVAADDCFTRFTHSSFINATRGIVAHGHVCMVVYTWETVFGVVFLVSNVTVLDMNGQAGVLCWKAELVLYGVL